DAVTPAWYQVAQSLGQPDLAPPPPMLLRTVAAWDVTADFEFGPEVDGRPRLEDATGEEQLASRAALATARVEWDVRLTCFDPKVGMGPRGEDERAAADATSPAVVIARHEGPTPQGTLHVEIPVEYESHLIQAQITAKVTDAQGHIATATTRVWNCVVAAER